MHHEIVTAPLPHHFQCLIQAGAFSSAPTDAFVNEHAHDFPALALHKGFHFLNLCGDGKMVFPGLVFGGNTRVENGAFGF